MPIIEAKRNIPFTHNWEFLYILCYSVVSSSYIEYITSITLAIKLFILSLIVGGTSGSTWGSSALASFSSYPTTYYAIAAP